MAALKQLSVAPLAMFFIVGIVNAAQARTFYGKPERLGQGFVRSFVDLDDKGTPLDIGVALTPEALSLPTDPSYPNTNISLKLPHEAYGIPFTYIPMTYYTDNYESGVFHVPNFYFPFFLIGPKQRQEICPNPDTSTPIGKCVGDELAKVLQTPAPDDVAADLIQITPSDPYYAQPGYGTRFVDPDLVLPIIEGQQPYNSVYEYGFFAGKMDFIAFGVRKSFFETQQTFTSPLKLPTTYPKSGYYPTSYSASYDAATQEYRLTLNGLTYREAPATLFLSSEENSSILSYDAKTGAFLNTFVPSGGEGLNEPEGLAFGPDGNLYVSSQKTNSILRFDPATGSFIDTFVPADSGGLNEPYDLLFGPDGNLYVNSTGNNSILRYDGKTGTFIDAFVPSGSGGLSAPFGLTFGPDGNLYVTGFVSNNVLRYNGKTGAFIDAFVPSGSGGIDWSFD